MAQAKLCAVDDCCKPLYARELCRKHYETDRRANGVFNPCSIPECNGNSHWLAGGKKGWCETHYMRWHRHGDTGTKLRAANGETSKWLEEHIGFQGDECLIWPFAKTKGYGRSTREDGSADYACRMMCEKVYGPPPFENADSAHSCGNGHLGCVHPEHLRWATKTENALDRHEHGTMLKGELAPNAVLTEAMVREARKLKAEGQSLKSIAETVGGSYEALKQMLQGRSWKWLR